MQSAHKFSVAESKTTFSKTTFERLYYGWRPVQPFKDHAEYIAAICMREDKKSDSPDKQAMTLEEDGVTLFKSSDLKNPVCFLEHRSVNAFATIPGMPGKNPGLITFSTELTFAEDTDEIKEKRTYIKIWEDVDVEVKKPAVTAGLESKKAPQLKFQYGINAKEIVWNYGEILVLPNRQFVVIRDRMLQRDTHCRFVVFDLEKRQTKEYWLNAHETFFVDHYYVGAHIKDRGIRIFSMGTELGNFFKDILFFPVSGDYSKQVHVDNKINSWVIPVDADVFSGHSYILSVASSYEHNKIAVLRKYHETSGCEENISMVVEIWDFNRIKSPALKCIKLFALPVLNDLENDINFQYKKIHMLNHQIVLEVVGCDKKQVFNYKPFWRKLVLLDYKENSVTAIDQFEQFDRFKAGMHSTCEMWGESDLEGKLFLLQSGLGCNRLKWSDELHIFPWIASQEVDFAKLPQNENHREIKAETYSEISLTSSFYPISAIGDYFVECRNNPNFHKIFNFTALGELKECPKKWIEHENLVKALPLNRLAGYAEMFVTFSQDPPLLRFWKRENKDEIEIISEMQLPDVKKRNISLHTFYKNRFLILDAKKEGRDHFHALIVVDVKQNQYKTFDFFRCYYQYALVGSSYLAVIQENGQLGFFRLGDMLENFVDLSTKPAFEIEAKENEEIFQVLSSQDGQWMAISYSDPKTTSYAKWVPYMYEKDQLRLLSLPIQMQYKVGHGAQIIGNELVSTSDNNVYAFNFRTSDVRCVLSKENFSHSVQLDKMGPYIKIIDGCRHILVPQEKASFSMSMRLFGAASRVKDKKEDVIITTLDAIINSFNKESKDNVAADALKYLRDCIKNWRNLSYIECLDKSVEAMPELNKIRIRYKDSDGKEKTLQDLFEEMKSLDSHLTQTRPVA